MRLRNTPLMSGAASLLDEGMRCWLKVLGYVLAIATLLSVLVPVTAASAEPVLVRGAYGRDDSASGLDEMVAAGFNTVNGDAYVDLLDEISDRGLSSVVWLGPYNGSSCSFGKSDAWVRDFVSDVKGHPSIIAYQLDDEPATDRVQGCPNVAEQLRERSELVKSIDPSATTYVTLEAWDGISEEYPYQYFADSADILGLVVYPCNHSQGCDFDAIDEAIAEADADGLDRYWAVMQAFEDDWYKMPTYEHLRIQLDRWSSSRMEGYFLYEWPGGLSTFDIAQLAALDSRFVDVPRGASFYDEIQWLSSRAITSGCNPPLNDRFCPENTITRGQMAAFLVRALGYTSGGSGDTFIDDDNSVFESDIEKLRAAGVTSGCNPPINNRFCPDAPVTRGQMAAFLVRALGYSDGGAGNPFLDDDDSVFELDIEKLRVAGVTSGCNPPVNNRFCPDQLVTRGQIAAFLYRALG